MCEIQLWLREPLYIHTLTAMDYLPYDIKETIATHLCGSDLATMAQVDPDYQGFFRLKVAPTFLSEFLKISKIYKNLKKIFDMKICTHDIMEDDGDHLLMSHILEREVEENELFLDDTEYAIWRTMSMNIDREPSMPELFDNFKFNIDDFNNFVDEELDDVLDGVF